jgi:hypothetical protein
VTRSYRYTAYGLAISSELPFPELIESPASASGEIDVAIRFGAQQRRPGPQDVSGSCYHKSPIETLIHWQDAGLCAIRQGREIVFEPLDAADERAIRLYILGTALAVLLQQRGLLVLHASAVVFNSFAVAFSGDCGMGKSTTAAALQIRGHDLLADDVIALETAPEDDVHVLAAFPQIKLCADAAKALYGDTASMPLVHPAEDKRARRIADGFSSASRVPLGRVYLLRDAPCRRIVRLSAREACAELIRFSFVGRIVREIGVAADHLEQCARIARDVPVCRLERPRDLAVLDALEQLVAADISAGG